MHTSELLDKTLKLSIAKKSTEVIDLFLLAMTEELRELQKNQAMSPEIQRNHYRKIQDLATYLSWWCRGYLS